RLQACSRCWLSRSPFPPSVALSLGWPPRMAAEDKTRLSRHGLRDRLEGARPNHLLVRTKLGIWGFDDFGDYPSIEHAVSFGCRPVRQRHPHNPRDSILAGDDFRLRNGAFFVAALNPRHSPD